MNLVRTCLRAAGERQPRSLKLRLCVFLVLLGIAAPLFLAADSAPSSSQLSAVRNRIQALEGRLSGLEQEEASARAEREQLDAETGLAQARVEELELVLGETRDEILRVRAEVADLAVEVEARRQVLARHLEMVTLLGRPGPLQLLYDAARGGDLERAIATVAVLTSAQVYLIEEFDEIQVTRTSRLAELSRMMEQAKNEAHELLDRRQELEATRKRVASRLAVLEKEHRRTDTSLADLRQREQALERLLSLVRSRQSFSGKDDIRRFRGALPWPNSGRVVRTFGKHYLPKYATYTVCNGLRFNVKPGAEIQALFPGEVAYARHFKGYGNMVVVDHGHDIYTLVAGMVTIHVRVGQGVSMGKRLGLAGPKKDDGNLYLEIRVGEKPQDPRRWLQLEGGEGN